MEVEVMKANNRPLAEGANWPMDCICNLCSCGSHSCASFALNGNAAAANNRCLAAGNSVDKLSGGDQREDSQRDEECAGCQFDSGERYLATAASGGKGTPAGIQSPTKMGAARSSPKRAEIDPELVHVMITRPEIASKPRDNILFEGDMDLRTTFETSYEALAKMRLDQWKKYQEATRGAQQATPIGDSNRRLTTTATKSGRQVSPIVGDYDDGDAGLSGGGERDVEHDGRKGVSKSTSIQQSETSRRQRKMMEPGDSAAALDTMATTRTTAPTTTAPRSRTPFAVAHTNSQQNIIHDNQTDWDYHYNLNQSSRSRQVSPTLNAAAAAQQYHQPAVERSNFLHKQQLESGAKPELSVRVPQQQQQQQQSAGYVDPDLASIIVYDANMNRLERVGIRKRSKYRPSTSLRSGARGLFGDQEPEKEQQSGDRSGRTSRGEDKAMQKDNGNNTVTKTAPPIASRGSVAIRARNLKNSSQTPDRMVYSERNLPVNTKRRIEDNVNMRDHLREQNIVDGGGYQSAVAQGNNQRLAEDEQVNEENNFGATAEEGLALEREMADIRLAEQEEAAANAEIQRVAALDPAAAITRSSAALMHQHNQSSFNSSAGGGGAGGGMDTRTSSRQSRLQRTCQEQSFHIGQNNYPVEPPPPPPPAAEKFSPTSDAKLKTSAVSSIHASPQSRAYNNLFSESPDFILTTGGGKSSSSMMAAADDRKTRRESSREDKKQRCTTVTGDGSGGGEGDRLIDSRTDYQATPATEVMHSFANQYECELNHRAHDGEYTGGGECRVARLGERFQYVGSRSGHKYFVEKILEPE